MSRFAKPVDRLETSIQLAIAGASLGLVGLMIYTIFSRVGFPYALEWLEGWTVDTTRRILEGNSLFVKPGIEWVPYTYTPIYSYLAAGVAKLIGVGFLAPRLVSIAAALGCLVFVHRLVARETGSVPCGLAAAGFLAGTFPLSGAWFDIGRVDTLFLFFMLVGFDIIRRGSSVRASVWGGVMMALAYLTKQTALLPLAALSLYTLFALDGKKRLLLPAVSGAIIAGSTLLFNWLTQGWYFFYTVQVPSLHGLGQEQMLTEYWTHDLGPTVLIAGLMGAFHLALLYRGQTREHSARFIFYSTLSVSMFGAAWTSRLHGGGWINVLQPAHAMLAILFGLGLGDIARCRRWLGPAGLALYGAVAFQLWLLVFDPRFYIPKQSHVADGDAFVAALADIEGEVYTPMHGHIPTLAGKRTFPHDGYLLTILRIGVSDITYALDGEFRHAFNNRRFAAVVIDYDDYRYMRELDREYRYAGDVPGSFSPRRGARSAPQKLYLRAD